MKTHTSEIKIDDTVANADVIEKIRLNAEAFMKKMRVTVAKIEVVGNVVKVVYDGMKNIALDLIGFIKDRLDSRYQQRISITSA